MNISVRTYQRWFKGGEVQPDLRPTAIRPEPKNKLSQEENQEILSVMNGPEYADLPPSQVVPKLADKGIYIASEATVYRLLRKTNQLAHRGKSKAPVKREPTTHIAIKPNQVWTWDITWLPGPIKGLYFKLYMILDIFSRKAVGWEVWDEENSEHAKQLVTKTVLREGINGFPLVLHSDNGSPMREGTFQTLLETLKIVKSYSRPRVSNDNPYSESAFRTLKYRPGFPSKGFMTLDEARKWVQDFMKWYNTEHQHSGIGFVTPEQKHKGVALEVLEKRKEVYRIAKLKHPERFAREIRKWDTPKAVALGPVKDEEIELALAAG